MLPGFETGEDLPTLTTGCGYACQLGGKEPVSWFWRGVSDAVPAVRGASIRQLRNGDDVVTWIFSHYLRFVQDTILPATKINPTYLDDLIGDMADYDFNSPALNQTYFVLGLTLSNAPSHPYIAFQEKLWKLSSARQNNVVV